MTTCGYDGTATAALIDHKPVWTRTDPKIHVSAELIINADVRNRIGEKYALGAWCPEMNAIHADLRESK